MKRWATGLVMLGLSLGPLIVAPGCNLGPFPDFLEQLDPLDPVQGEVKGWVLAEDEQTQVLVLSESGRFLHSVVNRDTSVRLEFGTFTIQRGEIVMISELRFVFPKESGGVSSREGASSVELEGPDRVEVRREALLEGELLTIDGWGTFIGSAAYVASLDLNTRDGRGCLLQFIQLSIRTAQSRIKKLGGGGTVIYHNNKSTFAGFLSGEQSIEVVNLLSPDTTIGYDDFMDFPEVRLQGSVVSHVNTSGNGTLDNAVGFRILGSANSAVGSGGMGGGASGNDAAMGVIAEGRLIYGPSDPIDIEQADVVGGSYDLELEFPGQTVDKFDWSFLADLDLRECYDLVDFSLPSGN